MIEVVVRGLHDAFGVGIWIIERDKVNGTIRVLRPVEFKWEEHRVGTLLPAPTISGRECETQEIIEAFIEETRKCGYGKDKGASESGELKATKDHLKDMQKLVFEPVQRNVTLPPPPSWVVSPGVLPSVGPATVSVRVDRVKQASKHCPQASEVLKELFPEVFFPGRLTPGD